MRVLAKDAYAKGFDGRSADGTWRVSGGDVNGGDDFVAGFPTARRGQQARRNEKVQESRSEAGGRVPRLDTSSPSCLASSSPCHEGESLAFRRWDANA